MGCCLSVASKIDSSVTLEMPASAAALAERIHKDTAYLLASCSYSDLSHSKMVDSALKEA